jgi:hypothetical protein
MHGFTVDLNELASCRNQVQELARDFGGVGSGLGPNDVGASLFGTLAAATKLATTCQELHTAAADQISAAQGFLRRIVEGLEQEGRRTGETETVNADTINNAWSTTVPVTGQRCPS